MAAATIEQKQKTSLDVGGSSYDLAGEFVASQVERLIVAVKTWHAADVAPVPFQAGTDTPITQDLDETIRQVCDATADSGKSVDPAGFARLIAMDRLAAEYRKFLNRASQDDPFLPPSGTQAFWNAYEWLVKAHETFRLPNPPSVKELRDNQKVSDSQICLIYGWVNEEGFTDVEKVFEEYAKPGTHTGKNWIHPSVVRRQKLDAESWAQRGASRVPAFGGQVQQQPGSAPPSLDEMVKQGCPAGQIAMVHKISEADAAELLDAYKAELALQK